MNNIYFSKIRVGDMVVFKDELENYRKYGKTFFNPDMWKSNKKVSKVEKDFIYIGKQDSDFWYVSKDWYVTKEMINYIIRDGKKMYARTPEKETEKNRINKNKCIRCGNPVGNTVFTFCDECWDKSNSHQINKLSKDKVFGVAQAELAKLNQIKPKDPEVNDNQPDFKQQEHCPTLTPLGEEIKRINTAINNINKRLDRYEETGLIHTIQELGIRISALELKENVKKEV
jgi:hypothetical protein